MLLSSRASTTTEDGVHAQSRSDATPGRAAAFRDWRRGRPFVGGMLAGLGGVEMFFSGQLDLGHLHIQLGIEGLQATVIPIALVLLGVLSITMPAHHVFYGILTLVVAIYSLVGVNMGGFIIGMLLSGAGGVLVVAWMGAGAKQGKRAE
ncbi:DUF6114 domain-containing protein [Arthrobacter bambusae]|uniref:DUF6114 domain-containing protein n=1 Tax=Arthrobacter bambusae TaxID=1338426 RepID=UPI0027890138|nr:DUF6114 domain-containing protein [Arthrobacter bambusae]MDQ0030556.1 hypothetical protein [Arthrobacter bambusae]MDQ0098473.1 hypothetical protein [Arthrobacter bambusae]